MAVVSPDPRIAEWLEACGIDPSKTRRVIIDINMEQCVIAYVERYVDEGAFDAKRLALTGMDIRIVPVDPVAEADDGQ